MTKQLPLELIVELRNQGKSLRQISKELGFRGIVISHTAIGKLLHRQRIVLGAILVRKQPLIEFDMETEFMELHRFLGDVYHDEEVRLQEARNNGDQKNELKITRNIARLDRVKKTVSKNLGCLQQKGRFDTPLSHSTSGMNSES